MLPDPAQLQPMLESFSHTQLTDRAQEAGWAMLALLPGPSMAQRAADPRALGSTSPGGGQPPELHAGRHTSVCGTQNIPSAPSHQRPLATRWRKDARGGSQALDHSLL